MLQGAVLEAHLDQVAPRLFHGFLNGHRHFARLALAHTDTRPSPSPTTVSAAKSENPTALDHLRYAVDRNHLFAHAVIGACPTAAVFCLVV
jgi:hypothetical protein